MSQIKPKVIDSGLLLTDDAREAIRRDLRKNYDVNEVAKFYHVSPFVVLRLKKEVEDQVAETEILELQTKVEERKVKKKLSGKTTAKERAEMKRLYASGKTQTEIAEITGRGISSVQRILAGKKTSVKKTPVKKPSPEPKLGLGVTIEGGSIVVRIALADILKRAFA